jgi:hypothetical protein
MQDMDAYETLRVDNEDRIAKLAGMGLAVHPQIMEGTRMSCSIDHLVAALLSDDEKDRMDLDYAGRVSLLLDDVEKEAEAVRDAMLKQKFGIGT